MKTLKIGKKNYKLEYSFEAAYDGMCVEKVIELMDMTSLAGESDENVIKSKMRNMPKLVVDLFATGLIENHADEVENAKDLVKKYLSDNADESFMSLSETIMDCMGDDGFLQLIGMLDSKKVEETTQEATVFPMNQPISE